MFNADKHQPPTPVEATKPPVAGPSKSRRNLALASSQFPDIMEDRVPSTNPMESTLNPRAKGVVESQEDSIGPTQLVDAIPSTAPEKTQLPAAPQPRKLVRRAGKTAYDPFDDMASSLPASVPAASTQAGPSNMTQSNANETSETAKTGKKSTLKRRVGQATQELDLWGDSQSTAPEPAPKRQKQAETQEMAPPPKRKAETEEMVELKKRVKKREQADLNREELKRLQAEAADKPVDKKAKKNVVKTSAAVDDEAEDEEAVRKKFLQVDYGRRKISETEKEFAREFNAVRSVCLNTFHHLICGSSKLPNRLL